MESLKQDKQLIFTPPNCIWLLWPHNRKCRESGQTTPSNKRNYYRQTWRWFMS